MSSSKLAARARAGLGKEEKEGHNTQQSKQLSNI
jgi:hypothetical protein